MLFSKHGSIKIRKASLHKCDELDSCIALRRCPLLDKLHALLYAQEISCFGYWTKGNISVLRTILMPGISTCTDPCHTP